MLQNKGKWLLAGITALSLLSGCTYESAPKEFVKIEDTAPAGIAPAENPAAVLRAALEKGKSSFEMMKNGVQTEVDPSKYWFSGYVKNRMMSRETTSMFDGIVEGPDAYQVTGRIARQEFVYYRKGDKRYIFKGGNWITAREEPIPIDVFRGYEAWLPFLDKAVQMPDEKVISTETIPYQIKITGKEWVEKADSNLFAPFKEHLQDRPDMNEILANTTIKMTVGIGKDDGLIHSYQTWIILPIPGGGYMDQEVKFTFFKYGENIQMKDPEEVKKYLLD
ncbi:hypothetical protein [Brevibacillus sp. VP]|uniref:hypothetical protein n=1 Tax=unclassified Brevibacillus TaxID=2684853 RepID=UPI000E2F3E96|nr:hypothetical protein [Brevibacillus sp. VP]RFB38487.1 hypothetical protein DZB91_01435 [Brevibacillus sp. VP]